MTELYPVNTMRGLTLPKGIEPQWMFQVAGEETLVLEDSKGKIYVRKATKWYKMVEIKTAELVEETLTVEPTPPEGEATPDPDPIPSAPAADPATAG